MKNILFSLLILAWPFAAFAASIDAEMGNYQKSLNDAFREFPDKPPAGQATGSGYARSSYGKKSSNPFTTSNFNKASQSAYTKAEVMKTVAKMALAWAESSGSIQGLQSSTQAADMAKALSASSDADFQKMGGLLNQESATIAAGNRPAAESLAGQIQSINTPYVPPGYRPTQGESWLVQAFNMAAGTVVSSLTGVLGALAVKDLLSGLGLDPSSWTVGLGNSVGSGLGRSAVNGQGAQPVLQNGAQSGIAQSGSNLSSAIQQSSGSIIKTNPVSSSQSGSAPSAGN